MYLRRDVAIEPTVDRWYAWSHLVAPATGALHLSRSLLPILDSFVKAPAVHAAAVKNPKMRGGPFLDLDASRVGDVASLAATLRDKRAVQLEFAAAVAELDRLLASEGTGASLEPLYARVPEPLRGYVELTYDTSHRPGYRLLEALLYRSPVHDRGAQGFLVRKLEGDERAFVLSTPRFAGEGMLDLALPFDHPGMEALFRCHDEPRPVGELRDALGLEPADDATLAGFLTEEAAPPPEPWSADSPRVRYLGHACVLIEAGGTSVLIDPLIGYESAAEPPRCTFADLPRRIDYVLVTHAHQDHVVLESLLPLRHRIGTVVVPRSGSGNLADPSLRLMLEDLGFPRVVELDELETIEVEGGRILGLPFLGEHGDLDIRTKLAHLVRLGGRTLLFAADSANLEPRLYDHLAEITGPIDALFLGMECDGAPMSWLYGGLLSTPLKRGMDQTRRLCGSDSERGMAIVERLSPERVFVYAMGQEPWCRFITSIEYTGESAPIVESEALLARCHAKGIAAERLYGSREIAF